MSKIEKIIEALLFASNMPLTEELAIGCVQDSLFVLEDVINSLNKKYKKEDRAITISKVSNGYVIKTKEEYHVYISRLFNNKKKWYLSKQGLEALSVIAYKQPITKADIEYIRGVNSDYIIKTLLEKELITIKGRDKKVGKPLLYGTSQKFLEAFEINDLNDLPSIKEMEEITNMNNINNEIK